MAGIIVISNLYIKVASYTYFEKIGFHDFFAVEILVLLAQFGDTVFPLISAESQISAFH